MEEKQNQMRVVLDEMRVRHFDKITERAIPLFDGMSSGKYPFISFLRGWKLLLSNWGDDNKDILYEILIRWLSRRSLGQQMQDIRIFVFSHLSDWLNNRTPKKMALSKQYSTVLSIMYKDSLALFGYVLDPVQSIKEYLLLKLECMDINVVKKREMEHAIMVINDSTNLKYINQVYHFMETGVNTFPAQRNSFMDGLIGHGHDNPFPPQPNVFMDDEKFDYQGLHDELDLLVDSDLRKELKIISNNKVASRAFRELPDSYLGKRKSNQKKLNRKKSNRKVRCRS